ncbi:uncharacterized protein BDZ99DRAFT_542388 [Mytilinidion resinicola]|uniref:YDG domain-containing protein n=1 Tax=Mytilinidion resinicola TaxID=574789 RepID=A0A6A6Z7D1_9PEZI|nr:uncharacterized protein BDZ99DRAFT_542388 [Mytilinidion resinicola]KAF2816147.1 hypothetical protein BDZ99DRAFT_542388 [Mytilinidion resinicola]
MSYLQTFGSIPLDSFYPAGTRPQPRPGLLSETPGALLPSQLTPMTVTEDLSISRLTAIATWIRDHLDPRIAREGADILKSEDVLILHDIFIALQHTELSANTLRATRIHKAILEISGKATRWPGRLADECDKILALWRRRFGPLEGLRPFLYSKGGRLDGIASVTETSRGAVLKRWMEDVPDLVAPEQSRRVGDLGFQPGDWWLNSLFAFRAGIINLETTEGGICFDSQGAYAILLRDSDEVDGSSPSAFIYRCRTNNPGRFRLTSADYKSRYPVRVLRSHNLTSLWAPRAGVRYDGLHKISGWTIRAATATEAAKSAFALGELLFDVKFERVEEGQKSMQEALKYPSAADIDDYAEFKQLRRLLRRPSHEDSVIEDVGLGMDIEAPLETSPIPDGLELASATPLVPASVVRAESMTSMNNTTKSAVLSQTPTFGQNTPQSVISRSFTEHSLKATDEPSRRPSPARLTTSSSFHLPSPKAISTALLRHPGNDIPLAEDQVSILAIPGSSGTHTATNSQKSSPTSEPIRDAHATQARNAAQSLHSNSGRASPSVALKKPENPAKAYVESTGLPLTEVAPWADLEPQPSVDRSVLLHARARRSTSTSRPHEVVPRVDTASPGKGPFASPPSRPHSSLQGSLSSPASGHSGVETQLQGSTLTNTQREERRARRRKQDKKRADEEYSRSEERRQQGLPRLSMNLFNRKGNIGRLLDGSTDSAKDASPLPFGFSPIRRRLSPITDQEWNTVLNSAPKIPPRIELQPTKLEDNIVSPCALPPAKIGNKSRSSEHVFASVMPASSYRPAPSEALRNDEISDLDGAAAVEAPNTSSLKLTGGHIEDDDKASRRSSQVIKAEQKVKVLEALLEFQAIKNWFTNAYTDGSNSHDNPPISASLSDLGQKRTLPSSMALGHALRPSGRESSHTSRGSSGDGAPLSLLTHAKTQGEKAAKKEKDMAALKRWQRDERDQAYEEAAMRQKPVRGMMREDSPDRQDIEGRVMFTDPFKEAIGISGDADVGKAQKEERGLMGLGDGERMKRMWKTPSEDSASREQTKRAWKKPSEDITPGERIEWKGLFETGN